MSQPYFLTKINDILLNTYLIYPLTINDFKELCKRVHTCLTNKSKQFLTDICTIMQRLYQNFSFTTTDSKSMLEVLISNFLQQNIVNKTQLYRMSDENNILLELFSLNDLVYNTYIVNAETKTRNCIRHKNINTYTLSFMQNFNTNVNTTFNIIYTQDDNQKIFNTNTYITPMITILNDICIDYKTFNIMYRSVDTGRMDSAVSKELILKGLIISSIIKLKNQWSMIWQPDRNDKTDLDIEIGIDTIHISIKHTTVDSFSFTEKWSSASNVPVNPVEYINVLLCVVSKDETQSNIYLLPGAYICYCYDKWNTSPIYSNLLWQKSTRGKTYTKKFVQFLIHFLDPTYKFTVSIDTGNAPTKQSQIHTDIYEKAKLLQQINTLKLKDSEIMTDIETHIIEKYAKYLFTLPSLPTQDDPISIRLLNTFGTVDKVKKELIDYFIFLKYATYSIVSIDTFFPLLYSVERESLNVHDKNIYYTLPSFEYKYVREQIQLSTIEQISKEILSLEHGLSSSSRLTNISQTSATCLQECIKKEKAQTHSSLPIPPKLKTPRLKTSIGVKMPIGRPRVKTQIRTRIPVRTPSPLTLREKRLNARNEIKEEYEKIRIKKLIATELATQNAARAILLRR